MSTYKLHKLVSTFNDNISNTNTSGKKTYILSFTKECKELFHVEQYMFTYYFHHIYIQYYVMDNFYVL